MLKMLIVVFVLTSSNANVFKSGHCPNVNVINNLVVDMFLGTWYEFARYPILSNFGGDCSTVHFSTNVDGSLDYYIFHLTSYARIPKFGKGSIHFEGSKYVGNFLITNKVFPALKIPFRIICTDYCSYAIVYSCTQISDNLNIEFCSLLTRERKPSTDTIEKGCEILSTNDFDINQFELVNHEFC